MSKFKAFFASILIIKFEYSAAVTKWYKCTQQDERKIVGNSLPNAPSRVRRSEKNRQAAEKEKPGEIELENEGSNED